MGCCNHRIIKWFTNTFTPSISMLYAQFELAKDAWDFLQKMFLDERFLQRWQITKYSFSLHHEPSQTVSDFYSKLNYLWNQLIVSEPKFQCDDNAQLFLNHRDSLFLTQFLMVLRGDFEYTRASLLHRFPLLF